MSCRTRAHYKFIRPGALAQLRDSRIRARSRRLFYVSLHRQSLPPSPSGETQLSLRDEVPCFADETPGPRFLQRKKLLAVETFPELAPRADVGESVLVAEPESDLVADSIAGGVVAAYCVEPV